MKVEVREIEYGSVEYDAEVVLRNQVLREPLGLKLREEDLERETGDLHFGAFLDGRLVGCLVLTPIGVSKVKMRQVAVARERQGCGVGRELVVAAEARARALRCEAIVLNARETAIPFYLRLNYEVIGEPFEEVGLPHRKMRKALVPAG